LGENLNIHEGAQEDVDNDQNKSKRVDNAHGSVEAWSVEAQLGTQDAVELVSRLLDLEMIDGSGYGMNWNIARSVGRISSV